jgi:hypothetical protein
MLNKNNNPKKMISQSQKQSLSVNFRNYPFLNAGFMKERGKEYIEQLDNINWLLVKFWRLRQLKHNKHKLKMESFINFNKINSLQIIRLCKIFYNY